MLLAKTNGIAQCIAKQNVTQTRNIASCYCLKTGDSQLTLLASWSEAIRRSEDSTKRPARDFDLALVKSNVSSAFGRTAAKLLLAKFADATKL